jgi:hypothetical protein
VGEASHAGCDDWESRLEVLNNTGPELFRMSGIDCPEKRQAFDNQAKQAMSALVFRKMSSSRLRVRTTMSAPTIEQDLKQLGPQSGSGESKP